MEMPVATRAAENSTSSALELMAKLAVLIIAALLFAGYGIRDGRGQTMATPGWDSKARSNPERMAALRRLAPDRTGAGKSVFGGTAE